MLFITKVCDKNFKPADFLQTIVDSVLAPSFIVVDFHGYLQTPDELAFVFGSRGTAIVTNSTRPGWILQNDDDKKELVDHMKMSEEALLGTWFQKHSFVRNLDGSGFVPRRLVSMMVIVQPLHYGVVKEYL